MVKRTVLGVLECCARTGTNLFAGYVNDDDTLPEGTRTTPVEVLDPEDGSGELWILAVTTPITHLDTTELEDVIAKDVARKAKAKLTDEELSALGLTRD